MRVRLDAFIGEEPHIDTSFLKRRDLWLPLTGIYVEYMLKGDYGNSQIDFEVISSDAEKVKVVRHGWNRFFINIIDTGDVIFRMTSVGKTLCETSLLFNVAHINVPLMYTVPGLLSHSVSDVRFFANRLSENLVNATRIQLFTPKSIERLSQSGFSVSDDYWKFFELLFSIITERGLKLYISPFGQRVPIPLSLLDSLKQVVWSVMERSRRFRVVWDFTEGLRSKELGGFVDGASRRFGDDIQLAVRRDMYDKIGGEGFSHTFIKWRKGEELPANEKGVKILRIDNGMSDFYTLRKFVQRVCQKGYGVEIIHTYDKKQSLHRLKYSVGRALSVGYYDYMGAH